MKKRPCGEISPGVPRREDQELPGSTSTHSRTRRTTLIRTRNGHARSRASALILAAGFALVATAASAHDPTAPAPPTHEVGKEHGSLAEIGHKLSDPTSNVWALFTEFDLTFSDGDVNTGNAKIGGDMNFQPVLPIPLPVELTTQEKKHQ